MVAFFKVYTDHQGAGESSLPGQELEVFVEASPLALNLLSNLLFNSLAPERVLAFLETSLARSTQIKC